MGLLPPQVMTAPLFCGILYKTVDTKIIAKNPAFVSNFSNRGGTIDIQY